MTAERITWVLLIAWALAFGGAFVAFAVTPAKDFGLAAGWNKVSVFMGWQLGAAVLAILCGAASRRVPPGRPIRWLGLMPLVGFLLLAAAILALVLWANLQRPSPVSAPPPGPVTAPAAVPAPEAAPALGSETE
ncbi:MAG: hypothetical protein QNJ16_13365 [Rhodobacter sp.]|nr:hypothetical protein [Rhodobacter sp.]